MNVIDAVKKAQCGFAVMCLEQMEWIICSSGALRWKSNRQPAQLGIKDIMSERWISEDELITISKLQIEEALSELKLEYLAEGEWKFSLESKKKFFDRLLAASYANTLRNKSEE